MGISRSRAALSAENELLRQQLAAAMSRLQGNRVRRSAWQRWTTATLARFTPGASPRPSAPQPIDPQEFLRSLIDRARTPSSIASDIEIIDELELLDEATAPEQMDRWVLLPADIQRVWLGYLVARMRAVKERAGESLPDLRARVSMVIKRLPEFSART